MRKKLTLSSRADPETLESEMTFSPRETWQDSWDGLSTSPSRDKKEFFWPESKFPLQLPSSPELWTRIRPMFCSDFWRSTLLKTGSKDMLVWSRKPRISPKRRLLRSPDPTTWNSVSTTSQNWLRTRKPSWLSLLAMSILLNLLSGSPLSAEEWISPTASSTESQDWVSWSTWKMLPLLLWLMLERKMKVILLTLSLPSELTSTRMRSFEEKSVVSREVPNPKPNSTEFRPIKKEKLFKNFNDGNNEYIND